MRKKGSKIPYVIFWCIMTIGIIGIVLKFIIYPIYSKYSFYSGIVTEVNDKTVKVNYGAIAGDPIIYEINKPFFKSIKVEDTIKIKVKDKEASYTILNSADTLNVVGTILASIPTFLPILAFIILLLFVTPIKVLLDKNEKFENKLLVPSVSLFFLLAGISAITENEILFFSSFIPIILSIFIVGIYSFIKNRKK